MDPRWASHSLCAPLVPGAPEGLPARANEHGWAIVLAGGEGARLKPLVRRVVGDERPKQYAPLFGRRSLLRQTLDRVARHFPPERTVVVSQRRHAHWMEAELSGRTSPVVLLQPENRGTAAGVLLPVYWIHAQDPQARVTIFPSDHFILEEGPFCAHTGEMMAFVDEHPEWLVMLGAPPTRPDQGYGWIQPGTLVKTLSEGAIARVARFVEKPDRLTAMSCQSQGWLWSTFVFSATVATLVEIARQRLPKTHRLLSTAVGLATRRREHSIIEQVYRHIVEQDFSVEVLQAGLPGLAVSTLPGLTWSDLGTPPRVFSVYDALGVSPPWMIDDRIRGRAASRHGTRDTTRRAAREAEPAGRSPRVALGA